MLKNYSIPIIMWLVFESIAVILWQALDNIFYLFNFSYIGTSIAIGLFLFARKQKYARHVIQFAVGLYMLGYLGFLQHENMQIEGFWYYLFLGVFEAATIHYAVAKIFGPFIFGRGWCGYACWTAMILDLLPFKTPAFLLAAFFCFMSKTLNKLCGTVFSSAILYTMLLALHWLLSAKTTGLSANISVLSPSF